VIVKIRVDWRDGLPTSLGGKQVTVTVGDRTLSGVVELASWSRFGQPFVEFEDGTSIDWRYDDDATVTVEA
jgi:hypothetical protein